MFYHLGRLVGTNLRKAGWVARSLTGTEAEAIAAEQAVGRDLAASFVESVTLDDHPRVTGLLAELHSALIGAVASKLHTFTFRAVLAEECNAFALPGGYVFVTRGVLELCRGNRDECAFVLGHEMAHVLRRHAIDRVMASSMLNAAVGRLSIAGGVLGRSVAGLAATLLQQGYSRDQELEADALGVRLAVAAGFDGGAAVRLLDRLAGAGGDIAGLAAYFASHPPFEVRVAGIQRTLREGTGHASK
jgi:predicted Zn-dependent protease